ncbi:hypothetical protein BOTNAR_0230g00050 [Botryotinia narcissicola]|uniref:Uncharacterized protein n=1 Tax=Botryotinia narcissicola TaxID=278944 RepID=A0A4Z1I5U5_9HELO|nr:hypothetical protein BOTNAR_0230g00050 [Botryotinia narcissicola]
MKVLLGKKKDGRSATPSTTSSANSSTHNVSTNSSSTTQVGSAASLHGGSGSGRGGKADSGNKTHREKDSHHWSDTSSSKAPVTKSRPELKASKSLLSNISLSRTKLDAEEKEKNRRLEEEHRRLETTKLGHFEYFKYELEETRQKSLEKAILATEEEKGKQESEVTFKRKIRNNADAELAKVHKQDDEIADKQLKILSQMSESNSYRVKVEKAMKKEDEERQKLKIK